MNLIKKNKMKNNFDYKVLILAGGYGTRLDDLTNNTKATSKDRQ